MNWPTVHIAIVDFRDSINIEECLNSIQKGAGGDQVMVNIVRMECKKQADRYRSNLKIKIHNSSNVGYAGAVNIVIRACQKEKQDGVVILINDDIVVDKNWVNPLIAQLKDDQIGAVAPKIYFYPDREFHHDSYTKEERGKVIWYAGGVIDWQNVYAWHWGVDEVDHGQFCNPKETDFATGCCVAFRTDLIDKIGYWDERYFLYLEDADWSVRTKRAGYKVLFEPKSVIWHINAGSTGGSGSTMHQYYQARNRILFASKFSGVKTKLALYKQALSLYHGGSDVYKKATRDAFLKRWGKGNI